MVAQTYSSDLLETVEEDKHEVQGTDAAGGFKVKSLGMGQHPQILLAHSKQLVTLHNADQRRSLQPGMDVPRGCLQMRHHPLVIGNRPLRIRTVGGVEGADG